MQRSSVLAAAVVCAFGSAGLTPVAYAQAVRDASAEGFVQEAATRGLALLRDGRGATAFDGFIDQVADAPQITRFVLGKYARGVDPSRYQAFAAAFRTYADGIYFDRFSQYKNREVKVTGSTVRRPGDVVVTSQVGGASPETIAWRVLRTAGGWKVVDVQVAGVWLAITEQQDFVSTLDNNRGDLDVLTRQLQHQNAAGRSKG